MTKGVYWLGVKWQKETSSRERDYFFVFNGTMHVVPTRNLGIETQEKTEIKPQLESQHVE